MIESFLALFVLLISSSTPSKVGDFSEKQNQLSPMNTKEIVLGGGCFWCVEAVYELIEGVVSVESGYAGGKVPNPTYREVTSGLTGHAEVVKITYDPDKISFEQLVDEFWHVHDPTTLNQQGNDKGTQYRSVIYYQNDEEKAIIDVSLLRGQQLWPNPIVTEVLPMPIYYPGEAYHQDYFRNNPSQGYCVYVVEPKVAKFKKSTTLPIDFKVK